MKCERVVCVLKQRGWIYPPIQLSLAEELKSGGALK